MSSGRVGPRGAAAAPTWRGCAERLAEGTAGVAGRSSVLPRSHFASAGSIVDARRDSSAGAAILGRRGGLVLRREPRAPEAEARLRRFVRARLTAAPADRRLPAAGARLALGLFLLLICFSPLAAAQPIPGGRGDVLVRRDCRSLIAREEVTLFGNGTVRLRSGPLGEERMVLGEVSREEVESLVAAIRREDLREAGAGAAGPEGDWVERCVLELPVLGAVTHDGSLGPGRPADGSLPTRFRYGHLDSLALPLARVVALVDDLGARVAAGAAAGGLPSGYRPRAGDVLRRIDGVLFRVVRATAAVEGMPRGWELQGVVQPLAVYVVESDLAREFVEVVSREEAGAP
jgi:hypothetical protein